MSEKKVRIPPEIFGKIAAGDRHAFEQLYRLTYKPMFAFCLSMTRNNEDGEDLLQETYIRIRNAAHLYREQGNPMAWMMKIAKNLYLMKQREKKNRQIVDFEEYSDSKEFAFDQIKDVDNQLLLKQLFLNLSEEERNIVILHGLMGLTFQEVADKENKPLGTMITKYQRAIKRLHKLVHVEGKEA